MFVNPSLYSQQVKLRHYLSDFTYYTFWKDESEEQWNYTPKIWNIANKHVMDKNNASESRMYIMTSQSD